MSKRRNERVSNGYRRRMLRQRVLAAYDVCAICGKPVDKTLKTPHPMSAEVDELIPVSRGGDPYSFTNCRLTLQQDEERQDRRTRTSAAGRQADHQTKLDAVQNVRHLTRYQGRVPGHTPLG